MPRRPKQKIAYQNCLLCLNNDIDMGCLAMKEYFENCFAFTRHKSDILKRLNAMKEYAMCKGDSNAIYTRTKEIETMLTRN
jgi:hypothetical protein